MTEGVARRPRAGVAANDGAGSATDIPQLSESGLNLFSLMEDINERLKLLSYETAFLQPKASTLSLRPLSRFHFALPGPPSEQFPYFAHLCTWLFSLCKREVLEWNEFDDPNSIASTIVDHLRTALAAPSTSPPPACAVGSGEAVLLVLDYMSSLALQQSGFTVLTPVYGTGDAGRPH